MLITISFCNGDTEREIEGEARARNIEIHVLLQITFLQ